MLTDDSLSDISVEEEEKPRKKKRKLKKQTRDDQLKKSVSVVSEQPSVYSSAEIRRHEKRLKRLKALEMGSDTESEAESENENVDPDLDINLRIFESSMASIENIIIGEIQCNVKDDKASTNELKEKGNKNSSVFKVSVNANFDENTIMPEEERINSDVNGDEERRDPLDEKVDAILSGGSCDNLTDDDSDLEILMSKPIVRKRAVPAMKKEKPIESPNKKLTMYDLIYDTMSTSKRNDTTDDDEGDERKNESKKRTIDKKFKMKDEVSGEIVEKLETIDSSEKHLAVPQLKVTADGEVVVDRDSLIVEQTGLSEARNAIANSEVIEEYGFTHTSYSKKRNYAKQWSPQDTLKFYHVLSTIGTDFSLMATLFPGRTRTCMKRKFKREEKANADLILKALSCKQNFDIGLLEKELRIKEERVNKLRENSKIQKAVEKEKKKKEEPVRDKKSQPKSKRRSYFETSIQCFQR